MAKTSAMGDVFHDRHSRGRTTTGWLRAQHTFSFGSFNDPARMGFQALRVINEDLIAGGSGFSEHHHDHFEILTFVLSGSLEHRDSAGHQGVLEAGDVQLISSGSGISHSERNPSTDEPTHLFQIWLHGSADEDPPRYQLLQGALSGPPDEPRLVASPGSARGALSLRAPVHVWATQGAPGTKCRHARNARRFAWLQLLEGVVTVEADDDADPLELRGGDALQLDTIGSVQVTPTTAAKWLWFDLA